MRAQPPPHPRPHGCTQSRRKLSPDQRGTHGCWHSRMSLRRSGLAPDACRAVQSSQPALAPRVHGVLPSQLALTSSQLSP